MSCCDKYMELVSLYVDGELSGDEVAGLLGHLDGCDSCRRYYEAMLAISGAMEETPAPEGFAASVMSGVRASACRRENTGEKAAERKPGRLRRAVVVRVAGLAACLALVIAAGVKLAVPSSDGATSGEAGGPALFEASAGESYVDANAYDGAPSADGVSINPAAPARASSNCAGKVEAVTVTHGGDVVRYTEEGDIQAIISALRFGGQNVSSVPDGEPDYELEIEGDKGTGRMLVWCAGAEVICRLDGAVAWIAHSTSESLAELLG